MARRDHELLHAVYALQALHVHGKQPVDVRDELDLALLGRRGVHVLALTHCAQAICRLVLVEHTGRLFPDEQRLLSHAQEHGNVLLRHDMPLAEARVLCHAADDLRHIMTQHMPHSLFGSDFFHNDTCKKMGMV